jgi:hypothetical protein
MSNEPFHHLMQGVDLDAAAAAFWQTAPSIPSDVREAVALSLQPSRSRTPRPHIGSSIAPSALHPSVLASDRLLLWTTPGGQEWQVELEKKYPDSSLFKLFHVCLLAYSIYSCLTSIIQVMIRSLDSDTRSNYGTASVNY